MQFIGFSSIILCFAQKQLDTEKKKFKIYLMWQRNMPLINAVSFAAANPPFNTECPDIGEPPCSQHRNN